LVVGMGRVAFGVALPARFFTCEFSSFAIMAGNRFWRWWGAVSEEEC